jgi:hypothetical protein
MELSFTLIFPSGTTFLYLNEVAEQTAKAMYPPSNEESELYGLTRAGCRINHETALEKSIESGMVKLLNPLSFEAHTFPFGEARANSVISIHDFKTFAATLQIDVVIESELSDVKKSPTVVENESPDATETLVVIENESPDATEMSVASVKSVDRNAIMDAFLVKQDADKNRSYWDDKLSRPPKWLASARTNSNRRGLSARWNPLLVAHALLDHSALNLQRLDSMIGQSFPDVFDRWKDETADWR